MPATRDGIAYRAVGPEDGEPVLLIMGFGGSGRMWWRLEPHLADEYRLLLIDNRGTGDSLGIEGRISMADMAADAVSVLDHAGADRAHVVGASMGGMIAQHVALDHRDRVSSLVLACTTPGGASRPPWRLLLGTAVRGLIGPERSGKLVVPILYSQATRDGHRDRLREDFAHRMRDATPQSTFHAQSRAIMGHDTRSRLGELAELPTLVLHGDEDALVPLAAGERLAEAIPGARLHVVPGAGHVLTTDAEEEVAEAILDHLRAASSASVPRRKAGGPAKT